MGYLHQLLRVVSSVSFKNSKKCDDVPLIMSVLEAVVECFVNKKYGKWHEV